MLVWSQISAFRFLSLQTVFVSEMKKPHISSIGVVPVRHSEVVDGLKVIMKGKPAIPQDTVSKTFCVFVVLFLSKCSREDFFQRKKFMIPSTVLKLCGVMDEDMA